MRRLPMILGVIALFLWLSSCEKQKPVESQPEPQASVTDGTSLEGSTAFCQADAAATPAAKRTSLSKSVAQTNAIFDTDFISAGVGKMRNVGSGTITLSGVSGTVTKAYLYWHGPTNSSTDVGNPITVNSTTVTGVNIGYSSDNCWGYQNSQAYRADVTALVQATGNGTYALSGFGTMNPNGASLIVFFDDGNATNNRDVVIFDGNDSNIFFGGIPGNPQAPPDPAGWNVSLSGITYSSGTANIQLHVGDGQSWLDAPLVVNSIVLDPGPQIFDGTSVPPGDDDFMGLWDIKTFDVTSFLSPGPNTLTLTTGVYSDCLGLIVALVDLPAGALAIRVPVDIKPTSCPNPLNTNDRGVLPVAVLGTPTFDATQVDWSTVKLAGVPALRSSLEDVATPYVPFEGKVKCNECTTLGADGYMDLTLKFDAQAIVAAIGAVADNDCVVLKLKGKLLNGWPIVGEDVVLIKKKK